MPVIPEELKVTLKTRTTSRALVAPPKARAAKIIQFIEKYLPVPEGMLVGKQMVLLREQKDFIRDVYDNQHPTGRLRTRRGILSIARKNGKTGLISGLVAAHTLGPESKENSTIYSAARSRDQASLVFNYAAKSIRLNPKLEGLVQITDSGKKIVGLKRNVTFKSLSADAQTAHGLSPALTIHDELGQVVGPNDLLYDALETAGGAQIEPLSLIISTQAANDQDLFSQIIDDGLKNDQPDTVVHLYSAIDGEDIYDPTVWKRVNFALDIFRSREEFLEFANRAKRMPSSEAAFRNLYLNMRTALVSKFIAVSVWKQNNEISNSELFFSGAPVHIGLDLSQTTDLTAAVLAVQDPETGKVHVMPFVYTPAIGIEERSKTDKAPYAEWEKLGYIIAIGSKVIEYEQVIEHLKTATEGMNIASVNFDRWRIEIFQPLAEKLGFADNAEWIKVGQGFKEMSPRLETTETLLLNGDICHGGNPPLTSAANGAIALKDPAGNRKLDKSKSSVRIDPFVAMVMAVHAAYNPSGVLKEYSESDLIFI